MQKPTFGATTSGITDEKRLELGAIWKRTAKNNKDYLNVKISASKEKLLGLLEEHGGTVTLNLVAFLNDNKNGNDNRPEYRIYEERKRNAE
jgi:uncharacterized protein (DUF736 family)